MAAPGEFDAQSLVQLGPYVVLGRLGEGGMGTVLRARDTRLDREVALKMLPAAFARHPDRMVAFRKEALALASLNHPNIGAIYGLEQTPDGALFLALELVEGESLAERLKGGPLPPDEALRVCAQVAEALEAAHEKGVIHRDIKPANVMLGPRGAVKVLDFGLAESVGRNARAATLPGSAATPEGPAGAAPGVTLAPGATWAKDVTRAPDATLPPDATLAADVTLPPAEGGSGSAGASLGISGTPGYMSPEQIRGEPQDARTDVFAFGALLYECLVGRRAFPGDPVRAMRGALNDTPDYGALPPRTPARVRELLARALARDPAERLADARSARTELEEALGIRRAAALRAGEAPAVAPNNLPPQTSSFVGRQAEIEACLALLAGTRLLTLTGVGGSGKTRLALKVAELLLPECPDGAWFVDFAPVTDAARVELTVATALGVREEPGQALGQALRAHLGPRRITLVLDNCEHLVGAVAALAASLLEGAPELRLLATSREALGVQGETLHHVPTLGLPPAGDRALTAEALLRHEAPRLFVERARLVRPEFAVTDADAPRVAELCRRLDGIPLALELAAARVRLLGVAEILARLDDRFRLLTGGSRTALPRQQTLKATIQWSYDQLPPEEQRFLRALAVFAGGWTLETATLVASEQFDEFETIDRLGLLVDKSLVVVDRQEGSSRYRFLETVRQFALEELVAAPAEAAEARARHLDVFAALAERAESGLTGAEQAQWLARLEIEHGNLLAALERCAQAEGGVERGLAFAAALSRFWSARGYYELGWTMLRNALERDAARAPTPARALALVRAGGLALYRGEYAAARPFIEESLAIHQAQGDLKGEARALAGLATVALYQHDFAAATRHNEASVELYRKVGSPRGQAGALHNLGYVALRQGDLERARASYQAALALLREGNDPEHRALTLADLGLVEVRRGDPAAARAALEEALELVRQLGARREGAYACEALAELALGTGEPARAARLLGAADALREAMGSPLTAAEAEEREELARRVRAGLGEAETARETARGRELSFENALDYARNGLADGGGSA